MVKRCCVCLLLILSSRVYADQRVNFQWLDITTGTVGTTLTHTTDFTPKAAIVFWNGRNETSDTVGRATTLRGFGFAVSATERCYVTTFSGDAAAAGDAAERNGTDAVVATTNTGSTVEGLLDLQSFGATTQTWIIDDQFPATIRVGILYVGGSDITNAKIVEILSPTPTGQFSVTGVGFQGDIVLMAGMKSGATNGDSTLSFGAAISSSERAVCAWGSNDTSDPSQTLSYCTDINAMARMDFGVAATHDRWDFVSWGSDGFTMDALETGNPSAVTKALVLKGGNYQISPFTTQTDTSTQIVLSGFGFAPAGGLLISAARAENSSDTPTDHDHFSVGAFHSASARGVLAALDEDAVATTEVTTAIELDAVYANISTGSAIQGLMDVVSLDSDGVTFIMDDADPSGSFGWGIFLGSASGSSAPACIQRRRRQ